MDTEIENCTIWGSSINENKHPHNTPKSILKTSKNCDIVSKKTQSGVRFEDLSKSIISNIMDFLFMLLDGIPTPDYDEFMNQIQIHIL
jgi:hypothetical protein